MTFWGFSAGYGNPCNARSEEACRKMQPLLVDVACRQRCVRFIAGITGVVSIDAYGDRNADYSLLNMNTDTGEFEVDL